MDGLAFVVVLGIGFVAGYATCYYILRRRRRRFLV
jgi:hypothetical protein